jgi:hypothetical protein
LGQGHQDTITFNALSATCKPEINLDCFPFR